MKRALVVLAAAAFLAVLFAKPFDFISHYTEHARHATHAVSTNPDVPAEQLVLVELEKASTETAHWGVGGWLILLSMSGIVVVGGLSLLRRKHEPGGRQRGLT